MRIRVLVWCSLALAMILATPVHAWPPEADAAYVKQFESKYLPVASPPEWDAYVSVAQYDSDFMGVMLDKIIRERVLNDNATLAWSTTYRMMSLNSMFRATGDATYLQEHLRLIRAVLAQRDDTRGKELWTGQTATAWGCDKYAKRGRAVFAVHTGMILYPMFDCIALIKQHDLDEVLSEEMQAPLLEAMLASLAWHDAQWRDGPGENEGHYVGKDQEEVCEGIPLPANRLSAMGRALWSAWEATGDVQHRDRAIALGHYIKNRLYLGEDGGYYWTYWLPVPPAPEGPVPYTEMKGNESVNDVIDDTSHASLTVSFPLILARHGKVYTQADVDRFAITITHGFGRLGDGKLLGCVTGDPGRTPVLGNLSIWFAATASSPTAEQCLRDFFLNYVPRPSPFDCSRILEHGKMQTD